MTDSPRLEEVPAAAIEAGQRGLEACDWHTTEIMARAVLVAASERIECPCAFYGEAPYGPMDGCKACAGSGFLDVLKQEKT